MISLLRKYDFQFCIEVSLLGHLDFVLRESDDEVLVYFAKVIKFTD